MGLARYCVGIVLLGACGGGGNPTNDAAWAVVAQSQPTALLSVSGTSASDVWVVGGDPRDGSGSGSDSGPVVEHYDGTTWTKLDPGVRNVDLWWVHAFDDGTVLFSGSNGTIVRYQDGAFTTMTTPGTEVVFGIWGATSSDVWAVGGNFGGGGGGFAWRYDGTSWANDTDVPAAITTMGTLWKVNGTSADDVWMSGTSGETLHWDGSNLVENLVADAQEQQASLFSVAGNSKRFVTVGGAFNGVLYENTGSGWVSAIPTGSMSLTGVALSEEDGYAVGQFGTVLRRGDSGWATDGEPMTDENLHATWIDPSGGAWAVGGQFDTVPSKVGVLLHKGDPLKGSFP